MFFVGVNHEAPQWAGLVVSSWWVPESPRDILLKVQIKKKKKSTNKYRFLDLLNQDTLGAVLRKLLFLRTLLRE